ncbi:MAG: hypothetical protein RL226_785 [Bacteroidota bacterium]|jgi:effector-binding domain-containing protein
MKFLKILFSIIGILLIIYLIMCAIGPKKMEFSLSKEMNASPAVVYKEVANFRNWEAWNPWAAMDSTTQNTYSGAESGLGARMDWTGEKIGTGTQEIVEVTQNEFIKIKLNFGDFPGDNYANWIFEATEGGTNVTWTLDGAETPFMFRGMLLLMGVDALQKDYETGLTSLKAIVEAKPVFEPSVDVIPDMWYVGLPLDNVTEASMAGGAVHGPAYGKIMEFLMGEGIEPVGQPLAIIRRYSPESMDITFAMPVADSIAGNAELVVEKMAGGRCLSAVHYGSYESSGSTWEQLDAYILENNIALRQSPYEVYVNDPVTVSNESEIMTKIVYPVGE